MADTSSERPPAKKMSAKTTLLIIGGLIVYAVLQPMLESWLGIELPSFVGEPDQVSQPEVPASGTRTTAPTVPLPAGTVEPKEQGIASPPVEAASVSQTGPTTQSAAPPTTQSTKSKDSKPVPKLGELRDIGGKVLQSTAGLQYRPGSQEGHRVKHILRHQEDDPDRPVHGVFDGDANELFAVIDEAYLYTFDHGPPQVTRQDDDGRTIYVVDLGRRIGYVGGQSGKRRNHPAAQHVQLVLDGVNVITAYPIHVDRRR